ncbi:MAG: 50S ribosomal protein L5 [Candidatus Campbellbacteria bacterium]|nr:50S ribosomal protein L5 [Candidatus Campbellbacteria bacterium]
MTTTLREKQSKAFEELKGDLGYENKMQAPRIEKIVISSGIGKVDDKNKIELIEDRLARITGQKPAPRQAKKSIASFKVREGDKVGYQVTLRGPEKEAFFDKLINVAIPRMRDFRGLSRESVDEMGNYTVGVREHTIFPETSDEELRNVFGFSVTIVTTAKSGEEALRYLEYLGLPIKKEETETEQ